MCIKYVIVVLFVAAKSNCNNTTIEDQEKTASVSPQKENLGVPTDVTLINSGKNHINISWTPSTQSTQIVFSVKWAHGSVTNTSDTFSYFTNLDPCVEYCFQISAVRDDKSSNYTKQKCFSTAASDPGKVKMKKILSSYSNQITISWEYPKSDNCTVQFNVQYRVVGSGTFTKDKVVYNNQIRLKNLVKGKMYEVKVNAEINKTGGENSDSSHFFTDTKPNVPTAINITRRGVDFLVINWTSISENKHGPILKYRVKHGYNIEDNVNDTSITIKNLKSCANYCVEVSAENIVGSSGFSKPHCFVTLAPNPGPVNMTGNPSSYSTEVNIRWIYHKHETCKVYFNVEYKYKGSNWSELTTNENFVLLKDLTLGQRYDVRVTVTSYNETVDDKDSKVHKKPQTTSFFFTDREPDKPSNITLEEWGMDFLRISWISKSENVTHGPISQYIVRGDHSISKNVTERSIAIKELEACTSYCLEISAQNIFGESNFTNSPCFSTGIREPATVVLDKIDSSYGQNKKISWRHKGHKNCFVTFQISYRDKTVGTPWAIVNTTAHQIMLHGLALSVMYELSIRSYYTYPGDSSIHYGEFSTGSFFTGHKTFFVNVSTVIYDHQSKNVVMSWTEDISIHQNILSYIITLKSPANLCLYILTIPLLNQSTHFPYNCETKVSNPSYSIKGEPRASTKIKKFESTLPFDLNKKSCTITLDVTNLRGTFTIYQNFMAVEPEKSSVAIVIVMVLILMMLLLVFGIVLYIYRRQGLPLPFISVRITNMNGRTKCKENDSAFGDSNKMRNLIEMNMPTESSQPPNKVVNLKREKISLKEFLEKIEDNKQDITTFNIYNEKMRVNDCADLKEEYKRLGKDSDELEKCLHLTKFIGKNPFNLKKNKFQNILPFDQNRVILTGTTTSDTYINANYIPSVENPKEIEFIAAQGPIDSTIHSFMQMIWEKKISCIVMLTQTYEDGKFKCIQYWPKTVGSILKWGLQKEIIILLESEKEEVSHLERRFAVTNSTVNEKRIIYHLHMHTWCDFSAPTLDHFHCTINRFHELIETVVNEPYLVHCSAGVGRTGTFICLDRIMRQLKSGTKEIDIYKTILELRAYRNVLVQRQAQYVFIHEFLDFFISQYIAENLSDGIQTV